MRRALREQILHFGLQICMFFDRPDKGVVQLQLKNKGLWLQYFFQE
jgi:hypothetical protein